MRPVERGSSPKVGDYVPYGTAFNDLTGRIGIYCSFCERRIATLLEVEHIQPKNRENPLGSGTKPYAHLIGTWINFLLACKNCNTAKGTKDVTLDNVYLPDRDNTFVAFEYCTNGTAHPAITGDSLAADTIALVNLNCLGKVNRDRVRQRHIVFAEAVASLEILQNSTDPHAARLLIAKVAVGQGFFSIWMKVFENDPDTKKLLIAAFPGTAQDCFDLATTVPISPRPTNGLTHGGKI